MDDVYDANDSARGAAMCDICALDFVFSSLQFTLIIDYLSCYL
jgi:hypothetical protein